MLNEIVLIESAQAYFTDLHPTAVLPALHVMTPGLLALPSPFLLCSIHFICFLQKKASVAPWKLGKWT
jgi:hypothetical protein